MQILGNIQIINIVLPEWYTGKELDSGLSGGLKWNHIISANSQCGRGQAVYIPSTSAFLFEQ